MPPRTKKHQPPSTQEENSPPAHYIRRQQEPPRVIVIGAGPVGLEAALYASRLGHPVRVFEREDQIAPDVRAWAHVPMFTDWSANRSPLGELALRDAARDAKRPAPEFSAAGVHPTGGEWVSEYLQPLARLLGDAVHLQTRVVGVARSYMFPEEHADDPQKRAARRFRLLTRHPAEERIFTADYVLDCTGASHTSCWLGAGGLPAAGEMGSAGHICYRIPDILGQERIRFLGKRTLLIGDGTSAATSALALAEVIELDPPGSFIWVTKSRAEIPYCVLPQDALPRRSLLLKKANVLATQNHPRIEYLPTTQVEAIQHHLASGRFDVTLQVNHETRRFSVDSVIANVGSRADTRTFEKFLHVAEPGLFALGAQSGMCCESNLIPAFRDQIRDAFRVIADDPDLDLYSQAQQTLAGFPSNSPSIGG